MSVCDELVNIALMVRGLQSGREAGTRMPYILSRLEDAERSVQRLKPAWRANPDAEQALDWLYRSSMEAPLEDQQRAEVLGLAERIRSMVACPVRPGNVGILAAWNV